MVRDLDERVILNARARRADERSVIRRMKPHKKPHTADNAALIRPTKALSTDTTIPTPAWALNRQVESLLILQ